MNDLEITKLCAEAMGYTVKPHPHRKFDSKYNWIVNGTNWNPLINDAQAMALLKRFPIDCLNAMCREGSKDFNRAICECVAKMATSPSKPD